MKRKTIKRIKSVIKKIIICGVFAGVINYFSLPIAYCVHSNYLRKYINDRRIQQVCRTDSHLEDIASSINTKNCGPLPLLKSAHALTARWLSFEVWKFPSSKEKERALEGRGDCSYYSAFTYSNFLYLADKLGRSELKNRVRLCSGQINGCGHAWLQVYMDSKWNDYEATYDPLKREDKIDFKNLNAIFPNYQVLENCGYAFSYVQFKDGKLVNTTDVLGSMKSGVGLIDFIRWKNIFKRG